MRIRKILLIYSARSVRALLKKNIYSEGSDISIVESESGKDALAQFNKKQFEKFVPKCPRAFSYRFIIHSHQIYYF